MPSLSRSPGGVWLACLGLPSDDSFEELSRLLVEVEAAIDGAESMPVLLANNARRLSDLFAPTNVEILPSPGVLLWILHASSFDGWTEDPARLQAQFRRFHRLGTQRKTPMSQWMYLLGDSGAGTRCIAALFQRLGISVRRPDRDDGLLIEVHRPEGVILSALGGTPYWDTKDDIGDSYPRTINLEKDHAEAEGDRERLQRLEEQERTYLATQIIASGATAEPRPVFRATRLARLLLEAGQPKREDAWHALCEELIHREIPLLVMATPDGRVSPRTWPDAGPALSVHLDLISFEQTISDLGLPRGSFGFAAMQPRKLFAWAAEIDVGIALNVYRDATTPLYIFVSVSEVRALAQGTIPYREPRI